MTVDKPGNPSFPKILKITASDLGRTTFQLNEDIISTKAEMSSHSANDAMYSAGQNGNDLAINLSSVQLTKSYKAGKSHSFDQKGRQFLIEEQYPLGVKAKYIYGTKFEGSNLKQKIITISGAEEVNDIKLVFNLSENQRAVKLTKGENSKISLYNRGELDESSSKLEFPLVLEDPNSNYKIEIDDVGKVTTYLNEKRTSVTNTEGQTFIFDAESEKFQFCASPYAEILEFNNFI